MRKPVTYKGYILTKSSQEQSNLNEATIDMKETVNELLKVKCFELFNKKYKISNVYEIFNEGNKETLGYIMKFLGGVLEPPTSYIDIDNLTTRDNDRELNEAEKRGFYLIFFQNDDMELEIYCESRNNILGFKSIIDHLNRNQGYDGDHYDITVDILEDMETILKGAQRLIEYTEVYDVTGQGGSPVSIDNTNAKKVELTIKSGNRCSMKAEEIINKINGRSKNVTKTRIRLKDSNGEIINYKIEEFQKQRTFKMKYDDGEFDFEELAKNIEQMIGDFKIRDVSRDIHSACYESISREL